MTDFLGTAIDLANLATGFYKSFMGWQNAKITLGKHIRNFFEYQTVLSSPTSPILNEPRKYHLLVGNQALWVWQLNDSLYQWLDDSGFKFGQRKAANYITRRHSRNSRLRYSVQRLPSQTGPLKFPTFGITGREVTFDTLFQKVKDALDKLETMMADDHYKHSGKDSPPRAGPAPPPGPGPAPAPRLRRPRPRARAGVRRPGLRGGYKSDEDGHDLGPMSDEDSDAPLSPQRLLQEQAILNLSQRLNKRIAKLEITSPDAEAFRQRRQARTRADAFRREVLREESFVEVDRSTEKIREKTVRDAHKLRKMQTERMRRENSPPDEVYGDDESDTVSETPKVPKVTKLTRFEIDRRRLEAERRRFEAERQRAEIERRQLAAERQALEAEWRRLGEQTRRRGSGRSTGEYRARQPNLEIYAQPDIHLPQPSNARVPPPPPPPPPPPGGYARAGPVPIPTAAYMPEQPGIHIVPEAPQAERRRVQTRKDEAYKHRTRPRPTATDSRHYGDIEYSVRRRSSFWPTVQFVEIKDSTGSRRVNAASVRRRSSTKTPRKARLREE